MSSRYPLRTSPLGLEHAPRKPKHKARRGIKPRSIPMTINASPITAEVSNIVAESNDDHYYDDGDLIMSFATEEEQQIAAREWANASTDSVSQDRESEIDSENDPETELDLKSIYGHWRAILEGISSRPFSQVAYNYLLVFPELLQPNTDASAEMAQYFGKLIRNHGLVAPDGPWPAHFGRFRQARSFTIGRMNQRQASNTISLNKGKELWNALRSNAWPTTE